MQMHDPRRLSNRVWLALALVGMLTTTGAAAIQRPPGAHARLLSKAPEDRMSAMGRLAAKARAAVGAVTLQNKSGDGCDNQPDCADDSTGPAGGQAEVSIAVDSTGQHVVLGFNDTRGFSLNPISVSGYLYSDDGGATFVDGGQLPSPGTDTIGTTRFPEVFGDPDVKYLGGCNFVYSSIVVAKFSATRSVQTLGVHRSTDCGHTWTGPFVAPSASNPHGQVSGSGAPRDAADKEFID